MDESELGGMGSPLFVGYELSLNLDGSVADLNVPAEASGYGIDRPPTSQNSASNRRWETVHR